MIILKIRLGYACISKTLEITCSKTYTYTRFKEEENYEKLDKITKENLTSLKKILIYNSKNNVHFFRITSSLIPLATKIKKDYITKYKTYYKEVSNIIKKHNIRVDFHPSEYCVLNSTKKDVVENSIDILKYHYNLLEALQVEDKILIIHLGSREFGKKNSITRFCNNFLKLEKKIQECIVIENDDKTYTIDDCLEVNKKIGVPVVLDYHHYKCNPGVLKPSEFIIKVLNTWKNKTPKMHFSSPKSKLKKEFRSHAEYININDFLEFLDIIKKHNIDVDIMLEAKGKDEALFRLVRQIKYNKEYKFIDESTFII